jgi:hypothetical protein
LPKRREKTNVYFLTSLPLSSFLSLIRFKNDNKVPGHIPREYKDTNFAPEQRQAKADPSNITGNNRYKYFRRPMLPAAPYGGVAPVAVAAPAPAAVEGEAGAAGAAADAYAFGGASVTTVRLDTTFHHVLLQSKHDSLDDSRYGPCVTNLSPGSECQPYPPGTQSDYRESEAQTLPYAPDYVIPAPSDKQAYLNAKNNTDGNPEVLTIEHLSFANGLPVGLSEVEHIERMRAKRAFEASLPPLSDVSKLKLRQKLMEEWEEAEWAEREKEIARLQEERLDVLKRAIDAREEESERTAAVRLERLREGRIAEKQRSFAAIQQRRVKQLRKLGASRKGVFESSDDKTLVDDYASWSSTVYAPMTREGKFPDTKPQGQEIDPKPFEPTTYRGLLELEAAMPVWATQPAAVTAEMTAKEKMAASGGDAYGQRREAVLRAELDQVHETLEDAKKFAEGERGVGACWPLPLAAGDEEATLQATMAATGGKGTTRLRPARRAERPETPSLGAPMEAAAGQHRAIVLLQRLLRGRAAQNEMFEGKERRIELINELQTEAEEEAAEEAAHSAAAAAKEAGVAGIEMLNILTMADAEERHKLLAASDVARRREEERELDAAAARIQAVARGRSMRATAAAKKAEQEAHGGLPNIAAFDADDQQRVLKIQAAARGRADRRKVAALRRPKTPEPTEEELAAAEALEAEMEAAAAAAAGMVETAYLPDLTALTAEDQQRIVQMQASARGYLARKQLASSRHTGATPPLPEIPENLTDADIAAIIALQASVKAHLKRMAAAEDDVVLGAAAAAAMAGEELPDLSLLTPEEQASVVKMQASARGYSARKKVQEMKDGPKVVGSVDKPELDLSAFSVEEEAQIIKIQAAARGHLTRNARKSTSAAAVAAAKVVEQVSAALPDLTGFSADEEAQIVKIQAAARGHLTRKGGAAKKKATFVAAPVDLAGFSPDDEAQGGEVLIKPFYLSSETVLPIE